jgi:esterase/lipase/1-acyl-sn-glycerol-3-phosphate acyltransferase
MPSIAFRSTKWTLDIGTKLSKADIRVHNADRITDDMAIIFVVNHFTRVETFMLPYVLHKHTGREVWSLAAAELFKGRIGRYLRTMGTVSTQDPDRDKTIVHSLLDGEHPWIIFPEGSMIKDKKVVGPTGSFRVYSKGKRRAPHTGAALLALRAEFYRRKLECIRDNPNLIGQLEPLLERFELESADQALTKRTVIVPVNVTYFPIRPRENVFLRLARGVAGNLTPRALEELSVEGTFLSKDTDIDITLGDPIDVGDYMTSTGFRELLACGDDDPQVLESDAGSVYFEAARKLMLRFMADIYRLTTINYDHIFATLIRHQRAKKFTERAYRNRIFLCAYHLKRMGQYRLHQLLSETYRNVIYEEHSPKFHDFMDCCIEEGFIQKNGNAYYKNFALPRGSSDFHAIRLRELTYVIANELEPLTTATDLIKEVACATRKDLSKQVRDIFIEEDNALYESDYDRYHDDALAKARDLGRPFLLTPPRIKGGVVLMHGYLSSPPEVRALAEHLYDQGYAVYGVRLRGHGTSPLDLARATWEDWYESFNRGYAIIKSLTDTIILGGFSMGGGIALLGAARKSTNVQAAFAINAPLYLKNYAAMLAPTVVTMGALLKKVGGPSGLGDFVDHRSEKPDINYSRNPVAGVRELGRLMDEVEAKLPEVQVPTLVMQGYGDPTVNAKSAQEIYEKLGTRDRELALYDRARHDIINGDGVEEIYDRIDRFLHLALNAKPSPEPVDASTA